MKYVIDYEVCALLFLIVVTFHYFSKKQFPSKKNRYFGLIIILGLITIALDIVMSVFISYPTFIPVWLNVLGNTIFYFVQLSFPGLLFIYVINLIGLLKKSNTVPILIGLFPDILALIGVILNPFTGIFFYFNDQLIYTHGRWVYSLYTIAFIYCIIAIIFILKYKQRLRKVEFKTIFIFAISISLAMLLQMFFPNLLLTGVGISFSIFMMFMALQNPDEYLDARTGLFNRLSFFLHVQNALEHERDLRIIIVDLNNMRAINNVFGSHFGDGIIMEAARRFETIVPHKQIYNIMGDKFIITMDKSENCMDMVDQVNGIFVKPWRIEGTDVAVSACVCYMSTISYCQTESDVSALLEYALCEAKKQTKDTVMEIDTSVVSRHNRERAVENALREALYFGELEVYYQPIYSTATGRFERVEALARFFDKKLGIINPNEFIPIAERTGLIVQVGEQVLTKVCEFIKCFNPKETLGIKQVELNLSAYECFSDKFCNRIINNVHKYGIDPSMLCFEITETTATKTSEVLKKNMEILNKDGFYFAMDDFGHGYANLDTIVELPFSMVKIDRRMLIAAMENPKNKIILQNIIKMFNEMNLITVLEGVETEAQHVWVDSIGVQNIQGYYYAMPMNAKELRWFLNKQN